MDTIFYSLNKTFKHFKKGKQGPQYVYEFESGNKKKLKEKRVMLLDKKLLGSTNELSENGVESEDTLAGQIRSFYMSLKKGF